MSSTQTKNSRVDLTLYPLFWLAVSFSVGIYFGKCFNPGWGYSGALISIIAVFLICFQKKRFSTCVVLVAFFSAGGLYVQLPESFPQKQTIEDLFKRSVINSDDPLEIEGFLSGQPETNVGSLNLTLDVEKIIHRKRVIKTVGRVHLRAIILDDFARNEFDRLNLQEGIRLRIAANLQREEKYLNPGRFSFTKILSQKGIQATATIKSTLLIERVENSRKIVWLTPLYKYRQNLIDTFKRKLNPDTSGVVIASMLGNRNYLTKETAENFRAGGTFHILVISGLHITVIGGVLLLFVSYFTKHRFGQFLFTSLFLWGYAVAVGAEIPILRAALMFSVLLFSKTVFRTGNLLNALGGCALVILLIQPEDLFNQSFQLTFLSLLGIISFVFPLIEKLRAIGSWMPGAENPFPPNVSRPLRTFCEALYWNELIWQKKLAENIWDCQIYKSSYGNWLRKYRLQKIVRLIFEGVLVTAVVQMFLLPILVLYFHRLSFSSVILNLWVGTFVILQNLAAILIIIFDQIISPLSVPFIHLTEFFNFLLLSFPRLLIENNLAGIRVPVYSSEIKIIYFLYFFPLFILTLSLNKWNPFEIFKNKCGKKNPVKKLFSKERILILSLLIYGLFSFLIIFHPFSTPPGDGKLKVDFLDVGQGDAALVTFPNGETMLIDGGGDLNFNKLQIEKEDGRKADFEPDRQGVGEFVVSEFLWEKGYSKIDYLVATHDDADHLNGLINVAKNFRIKAVFVGRRSREENFREFEKVLERKNVSLALLQQEDTLEIGGVRVEVLNPTFQKIDRASSNNDSIVLRLNFGYRKFLFTGDIEKETENNFLENPAGLKADIVKVPHHGSRTSSTKEFIKATEADFAIIPVGRKSRFGHPHGEVVERWRSSGARVLKTGDRGTITVSTDGKNIEVQFFVQ